MKRHNAQPASAPGRGVVEVALLATALVMLASYLLLRYSGRWGEGDAALIAQALQTMSEAGRLLPSSGAIYPNGYGYQALSVFILKVGSLTTTQFQLYLQLFLMAWIVLPAWLLYRELTGSRAGATLATAIILVQPEFLFSLLRGTHEKFTRGLILMALYLFVKSLGQAHSLRRLAGYILAFYLVVYGFITFNNLLAFSMIAALVLALGLLTVMRWWTRLPTAGDIATERRLRYAVLTASIIVFLFTFYFYPPARSNILVVDSMAGRTASLVLDVEQTTTGPRPYTYTGSAWISGRVYLVLSSATWILLVVSALIWLWQSLRFLMRREATWQASHVMLWGLYGAFAIQGALSILVDLSGALSANLQVRLFPAFAMLAAPVAARAYLDWQASGRGGRRVAWVAIAAVLAGIGVLSVMKATNEPLVSNKWPFYIPAEMQALDRAEIILSDRTIWTESDERLEAARIILFPTLTATKNLRAWAQRAENTLVSEVILARQSRTFTAPPLEADSLLTYDNGQARIYHLRPLTPFQR